MSLFWTMRTAGGSGEASKAAARATGEARRARTDVQEMEERLDRALLACEAMWTVTKDTETPSPTGRGGALFELTDRVIVVTGGARASGSPIAGPSPPPAPGW